MDTKYTVGINEYKRMTTTELRNSFLFDNLFIENEIVLNYCESERAIIGGVVPAENELKLQADKEIAADYFCERREIGIINIGGSGVVDIDGNEYAMDKLDGLYIGRGSKNINFKSNNGKDTAYFYLVSYPAHCEYPTTKISNDDINQIKLGTSEDANKRTIFQYIHPDGIKSCQLVMGFTVLENGSVWNTMPAHTHQRRTETYLYFNIEKESTVFHFMGLENETRHISIHDKQAVSSPIWSIHSGCGTKAYSFIWAMGGENQNFTDMNHIKTSNLK